MRKHAKNSHAHVNSFSRTQKSFLCACKSLLEKINVKNPEKINVFTGGYYIPNIKLNIVLYKPFMLNMVRKSTERFRNLSLEK